MAARTSRSVGWPTAAVMRRTWRLRPSLWMLKASQAVGMLCRTRIGGSRSHSVGRLDDVGPGGQRHAIVKLHTAAQRSQRGIVGHAFYLHPIGLFHLEARIGNAGL